MVNPEFSPPQGNAPETEKIGHECALVGIVLKESTMAIYGLASSGLSALQHRGQEAAGIAADTGTQIILETGLGLLTEALPSSSLLQLPPANRAIGHTRYSVTGRSNIVNTQPFTFKEFALAHNGNITTTLEVEISPNEPTSDSFMVGKAIAQAKGEIFVDRAIQVLERLEGSYVFLFLADNQLYVASDPWQMRPCLWGRLEDDSGFRGSVVASESVGLEKMRAGFVQELPRGSLVRIGQKQIETLWTDPRVDKVLPARCSFETAYFAHAASMAMPDIQGELRNHTIREKLGYCLAERVKPTGEIVVSVPRSGSSYSQGVAQAAGKPLKEAIHVNSYKGRTFIQPYPLDQRLQAAYEKYFFIPEQIRGSKIILVDDSVVRGNTMRSLILVLFALGAEEIELLVGIPPIKDNCYWGIDFQNPQELIYNQLQAQNPVDFEQKLASWLVNGDPGLGGRFRVHFQQAEDYVSIISRVEKGTALEQSGGCYFCISGTPPVGMVYDGTMRKNRFE